MMPVAFSSRLHALAHRIFVLAILAMCTTFAQESRATFHTYRIEQLYSNADGTVQFIVLHEAANSNGEHLFSGHSIRADDSLGGFNVLAFPNDLPNSLTADTRVLIATEGFAALNLVKPDYVVGNRFLAVKSGSVNFGGVDEVAYAVLPVDGVMALSRNGVQVPNLATNFAGQSASVGSPTNYEGLWWNAPADSESGWGINFAHQGDVIFATWFTYDTSGKAWWLSMSANKTADATYAGTLYVTAGPAFNAVPFDPAKVTATAVGTATLAFSGKDSAKFAYSVNGVAQTKTITRQSFGTLPKCAFGSGKDMSQATNYQDLWWNAPADSESGWGINLTHQGDIIFATWFTYGLDGKPMWLSVTANKTAARTYSGTFYRTTGPAFNAVPFDPHQVTATPAGTATLTFASGNAGSFAYTVDGVQQTRSITRQIFRTPGTICE